MARPNLGSKRVCPSCGAKFYDLGRDPAVCPECGAEHPQANFQTPRRVRPPAPRPAPRKPAPKDEAEDDIRLDDENEDEEDVEELDDDDLGEVVPAAGKTDGEDEV